MKCVTAKSVCILGGLLLCGVAAADAGGVIAVPAGYAASAFQSPVAFGGSWGSVGLAALYYEAAEHKDGSLSASLGLGDPNEWLGLDAAAVLSSLSKEEGSNNGLGDDGSFALKLHRNLGNYTAVAVGGSALGRWGTDGYKDNNPPGYYLVLTRAVFVGDHVLMLSGGAGKDVANKPPTSGIDPLGSAAFYFTHWASAILEYNGFSTNFALSVAPLPRWIPLTITAGAVDLAEKYNAHPKASISVGLGFHF